MGFLAASASVCYFQVTGSLKQTDQQSYILQQLAVEGFSSIEKTNEELSVGWVQLDDYDNSSFASVQDCWREQHLCFTLRQDRRKLPSALIKREVARLSEVGLQSGLMLPENAAALVGAGALSVLVFPLVAVTLQNRTRADEQIALRA